MYNLFRFLVRFHLLILFLLLEAFCFYLIGQNSRFHKAFMVTKINDVNGNLFTKMASATAYFNLGSVNDSLVNENAYLRSRLRESLVDTSTQVLTKSDSSGHKFVQNYTYIPAKVIRNSVNLSANYIYLDKGAANGMTKQMGVMNTGGVVGQVVFVTDHYAAVMSLLNKDFKVSAKVRNSNYFGPLYWLGKSPSMARLDEIPKHVKVKIGDTIVTSGYSSLFPENVMIGIVKKINAEPEKNFLEIDVALSANLNNLSYVYAIKSFAKNELAILDTVTKPAKIK